ncbi:hypothetical protein ES703_83033 [subsurface metagenome]
MIVCLENVQELGKNGQIASTVFILDEFRKWLMGDELIEIVSETPVKGLLSLQVSDFPRELLKMLRQRMGVRVVATEVSQAEVHISG